MVTIDEFSRLVSGIYAAAVTPQQWETAIRGIHRSLGGGQAGLFVPGGATWSAENTTLPAEAAQRYADYYHRLDAVLPAVQSGSVGEIRTGSELMPLVRKSEFYHDWLRPLDIDDGLFVRLNDGPKLVCLIVAGPRRTEDFATSDRVTLMRRLVPHLQQALRTGNKIATLAESGAGILVALEAIRHGAVIVGIGGWVLSVNVAAERVLRAEDGLGMRSGRIAAASPRADRELHRTLHAALEPATGVRGGRSFLCERISGRRPYVVHVVPLGHATAALTPGEAKALVLITDPDEPDERADPLLTQLYGLTNAEADIATRIAHGVDVKEISESLSVSITTVRKHLQHVYDKTDTHRQAELVRLLLTLRS